MEDNKMIKVLYIYGYGSNEYSETRANLQEILGNGFSVMSVEYNQKDPKIAIEKLKLFIKSNNIDVVIGSSLGGFYALKQDLVPKIVINPCMCPSYELPKIGCPLSIALKYKDYENYNNISEENRKNTLGLFGNHDELINYQSWFKKYYGGYIIFSSGHRPNKAELQNVSYDIRKQIYDWIENGNKNCTHNN